MLKLKFIIEGLQIEVKSRHLREVFRGHVPSSQKENKARRVTENVIKIKGA